MAEKDRFIEQIRELQEQRKIFTTYLVGMVSGSIALLLSAQSPLAILTNRLGLVGSYGLVVMSLIEYLRIALIVGLIGVAMCGMDRISH